MFFQTPLASSIDLEIRRTSDLRKAFTEDEKYSQLLIQLERAREDFTRARAALGTNTGPPRAYNQDARSQQEEEKSPSSSLGPQASFFSFKDGFPFPRRNARQIPLYDYLGGKEKNIFEQKCTEGLIRWMHLPANNMNWIEKVVSHYYGEDGSKFNRHVQHSSTPGKMAESLLHHEGWYGNVQGPQGFRRYMRPRCFTITPDKFSNPELVETASKSGTASEALDSQTIQDKLSKQNLALYMPYLHWEYSSKRDRMMKIVNNIIDPVRCSSQTLDTPFTAENFSHLLRRDKKSRIRRHIDPSRDYMQRGPLGILLLRIAAVSKAMDEYVDRLVLKKEIGQNSNIKLRRTLIQSNRWASGLLYEEDQIIRQNERNWWEQNTGHGSALDVAAVITSFPARFGARGPDPSDVHQSLCQGLAKLTKGEVTSAYALATMVVDQCTKVFFDRLRPQDERPDILDTYGNSISFLATLRTAAFERFWRNTESRGVPEIGLADVNFKLNLEGTLLREAQHIGDELQIIAGILKTQSQVMEEFSTLSTERVSHSLTLRDNDATEQTRKLEQLLKKAASRHEEIEELVQGAAAIHKRILDLLDLRQKQALIADMPRQQFLATRDAPGSAN
ncbi:hypothetical protein BKA64DRAFT_756924 [Cadophora sp. MPI-SDFR-AT-0126]|nr:hypothetical protein BKA64DRAFT_756924 [Leotiomycetes sp. MPI-SDFR-AT-0126]